ncbi:MAG: alkene reductase [Longimicrobiales bacterium]|nr:alkene reductase [Longimicrobiales bacterium]
MSDSVLFAPFLLGPLALPNRAVMAPMTRCRADGTVPNALMAEYYAQRASAGLIVTEGVTPDPDGRGYARMPGIWSDAHLDGWRLVTSAVHESGGRIFVQLMHAGRVGHPANLPEGGRLLAPSAVPLAETKMWVDEAGGEEPIPTAEAMDAAEVEAAIDAFVRGAHNAIAAGFDGVELHGANGYLIEQFLNPHTNRRDDAWGGSVEARARFALEVAERVVDAIGGDRVGMRLSPWGVFNEMPHHDEIDDTCALLARRLGEIGLVYLHILDHSPLGAPEVPASTKEGMREAFPGAIILAGGYDHARAIEALEAGRGDLIAFGRPFLANPDLLERYRRRAALNEPRPESFHTPGATGYIDYPTLEIGECDAAPM